MTLGGSNVLVGRLMSLSCCVLIKAERFCCQVRSKPRQIELNRSGLKIGYSRCTKLRLLPEQCCHLQLLHGPITVGTIPNENTAFTTCVDPISPPISQPLFLISQLRQPRRWAKMVEAPGTAPGSALLISQHVYRHSWNSSPTNIVVLVLVSKNSFDFDAVSANSSVEKSTLFSSRTYCFYRLSACVAPYDHAILTI